MIISGPQFPCLKNELESSQVKGPTLASRAHALRVGKRNPRVICRRLCSVLRSVSILKLCSVTSHLGGTHSIGFDKRAKSWAPHPRPHRTALHPHILSCAAGTVKPPAPSLGDYQFVPNLRIFPLLPLLFSHVVLDGAFFVSHHPPFAVGCAF